MVRMTRINLVPIEELSDRHLVAEYRELPRCLKQEISLLGVQDRYLLGAGHMKWARLHGRFLLDRYSSICDEMRYRGFNVGYPAATLSSYLKDWMLGYVPDERDIELSRDRIVERISQKPGLYRWTKREIPDYVNRSHADGV